MKNRAYLCLLMFCFLFVLSSKQADAQCAANETEIIISITTDNYPGETSWQLLDQTGSGYMNASAFSSEAKNFCAKHDMSHEKIENFDEHTAAYYFYKTIAQMLNLPKNETSDSEMYHICYRAKKISDMEMYKYYGCKSIVKSHFIS